MAQSIFWNITGKHKDKSYLTGEEVRELQNLDEYHWGSEHFEAETFYIADFETCSISAWEDAKEAAAAFAANHPDVILTMEYQYDTAECPDAFRIEDGRVRDLTGHVVYTYDDNGEEVKIHE